MAVELPVGPGLDAGGGTSGGQPVELRGQALDLAARRNVPFPLDENRRADAAFPERPLAALEGAVARRRIRRPAVVASEENQGVFLYLVLPQLVQPPADASV